MARIRFSRYLRDRFNERVQRIPLHAGFTCPNRDGSVGYGGCIYCDNASFNPGIGTKSSIEEQIIQGMRWGEQRYGAKKFLAYFQTFSNTYAPVHVLKKTYMKALNFPDVVGLIIGTRPDCLNSEIVELLLELSQQRLVWLELGVQSCHDVTLRKLNRGHCWEDVEDAVNLLRKVKKTESEFHKTIKGTGSRNLGSIQGTGFKIEGSGNTPKINIAAHVILGLPGETTDMMMQTANSLSRLGVDGVKLHHLHAVKGTELAEMYHRGAWKPLAVEEYIDLAVAFLKHLPDPCVVMRLVGDCPEHLLVAPRWKIRKQEIDATIWSMYRRTVNI